MRRRALLTGLLFGGLAMLGRALAAQPILDIPLDPDEGGTEEEEPPPHPPSTQQAPSEPPPLEPDDEEEERPPSEPA
jgi:hypothetical protein